MPRPPSLMRYLLVGAWNTVFGYAAFAVTTAALTDRLPLPWLFATAFSSLLSITVSFLGYKWLVFRTRGHYLTEWLRCVMVYGGSILTGMVLMAPLVWIADRLLPQPELAPYVAGAVLTTGQALVSFVLHARFTFSRSSGGAQ